MKHFIVLSLVSLVLLSPVFSVTDDSTDDAFEEGPTGEAIERQGMVDEMGKVTKQLNSKLEKEKENEILTDKINYERLQKRKQEMDEADEINKKAKAAYEKAVTEHTNALNTLTRLQASLKVALETFKGFMAYAEAERMTFADEFKFVERVEWLNQLVDHTTHQEATNWYKLHPEYKPLPELPAEAAPVADLQVGREEVDPILKWIGQSESDPNNVRDIIKELHVSVMTRRDLLDQREREERERVERLKALVEEWTITEAKLRAVMEAAKAEYDRTQKAYDEAVGRYEAERKSYELSHAEFLKKMDLIRREQEVLAKLDAKLLTYASIRPAATTAASDAAVQGSTP